MNELRKLRLSCRAPCRDDFVVPKIESPEIRKPLFQELKIAKLLLEDGLLTETFHALDSLQIEAVDMKGASPDGAQSP